MSKQPQFDYLYSQITDLQTHFDTSTENGLFCAANKPKQGCSTTAMHDNIQTNIIAAFKFLRTDPPDIDNASMAYSSARMEFSQAIDGKGFWWRFVEYYGGLALTYLISVFIFNLVIWFGWTNWMLSSSILWVPTWAFIWGSTGGVLQGFWYHWQNINNQAFRRVWYTWYISLPLIGAILGALVYFIFYAGFIAATGQSQFAQDQQLYFVMLLCGLGGYSAVWAINLLNQVSALIKIGKTETESGSAAQNLNAVPAKKTNR